MQLKSHKPSKSIDLAISQADHLPNSAHIRPKVAAQLLGISMASFWRLVSRTDVLKTHKLTERTTTVTMGDLRAFIASRKGV